MKFRAFAFALALEMILPNAARADQDAIRHHLTIVVVGVGRAAELPVEKLTRYVYDLKEAGAYEREALEIISALVRNQSLSPFAIDRVVAFTPYVATAAGMPMTATANLTGRALTGSWPSVEELDHRLNLLSAAEVATARKLAQSGKQLDVATMVFGKLRERFSPLILSDLQKRMRLAAARQLELAGELIGTAPQCDIDTDRINKLADVSIAWARQRYPEGDHSAWRRALDQGIATGLASKVDTTECGDNIRLMDKLIADWEPTK